VLISRDYEIYCDAYAIVRQDGLLGPKYLEIIPGNPLMSQLEEGSTMGKPSVAPVSVDQLMQKFSTIASHVEEVARSLDGSLGGVNGEEKIRSILNNLDASMQQIASFSQTINQSVVHNEDNLNKIFEIGAHVARISRTLETEVLPSVRSGIEKISEAFDRDLSRIATHVETTADAFGQASIQARDGFKSINSVVEKIDEGKGLLGQLVNDEETYTDLKVAVVGLKNYFAKTTTLQVIFDSHAESMHRPAEHYRYEDSKGYLDIRIHPTEDKFYLLQLASSEKGFIDRAEVRRSYLDECDRPVDTQTLDLSDKDKLELVFTEKDTIITRNVIKVGLQFGKIFGDIAFRFGLFEGTVGLGVDVDVPLRNNYLRWVTTMEAFDFRGWNRIHDRRPHFKWLNRMFFMRNIYAVFGADDFISKHNASAFFGVGLRFGDEDVKFFLSSLTAVLPSLSSGSGVAYNTCI
jgi:phospholipid/cholesterol/gamma-HCH transport system substrate-binding protein